MRVRGQDSFSGYPSLRGLCYHIATCSSEAEGCIKYSVVSCTLYLRWHTICYHLPPTFQWCVHFTNLQYPTSVHTEAQFPARMQSLCTGLLRTFIKTVDTVLAGTNRFELFLQRSKRRVLTIYTTSQCGIEYGIRTRVTAVKGRCPNH